MRRIFLLILVLILGFVGCAKMKDFSYGMNQISSLNSKYQTTMETYPQNEEQINSMLDELGALKGIKLDTEQEPYKTIIDYRILNLEAEKLYIESQKYRAGNIAATGFGCKSRPLIIESAKLRNGSATKGFEAASLLSSFVSTYPAKAKIANVTQKNVLFLNASFYEVERIAVTDSNIINNFCPENVTLGLYREQFERETNFSKENINSLSYEQAVQIWKQLEGLT